MKFTMTFIKAALLRAIKTAAQTSLGMITVGAMASEIDWLTMLSVAGVSAVYSLLTSIVGGIPEAKTDGNLIIDTSAKNKDLFRFQIDKPIADIKPGDTFVLSVKEE